MISGLRTIALFKVSSFINSSLDDTFSVAEKMNNISSAKAGHLDHIQPVIIAF